MIDIGVDTKYRLSSLLWHLQYDIDEAAHQALLEHWARVENLRRSVGQKFRWAA